MTEYFMMESPMKTLEVVAGIIVFNGKILCMQRNAGKYDYVSFKYEFPGGKVEPGESNVEALKRELHEEMEMDVTVGEKDFFLTVHHEYPDFAITMHSYICRVSTDQFVRKEHVDHIWLEPQGLLTLDWAPADIPIVQKVLEVYGHGL
jgi:8-oxo-dGTP diphosphatase